MYGFKEHLQLINYSIGYRFCDEDNILLNLIIFTINEYSFIQLREVLIVARTIFW